MDLLALARALSTSPVWREMSDATLVVRTEPPPVLGVVGRFDAAAQARLAALGPQITNSLARLRYVSYAQAEDDCELLAGRLVERFGREDLRRFRFAAIPRGGLVVLGMLSYVLGLEHPQLEPPHPPDVPLVAVDDCALSGHRFGRFLTRLESRRVVFAHLYSHPEARSAIEAREPRVEACVAAQDLRDHAPERLGAEYPAWKEEMAARLQEEPGYWLGQPDHLCFPWNEPDLSVWNPVTERFERGWRVVPPELCLKNRPSPGEVPVPVRVQPACPGPLRPPASVLFGEFEGRIVIGNTRTKESVGLSGVAADMWNALVRHGSLEGAMVALSKEYEVDEATLRIDLRGFVEDLLAQDLLERTVPPPEWR